MLTERHTKLSIALAYLYVRKPMRFFEFRDVDCSELSVCWSWISETKAAIVAPVCTARVVVVVAVDVCSPPGIDVRIMIHDRHVVHWFGIIVCRVCVGVQRCVIIVVICRRIPVISA